MRRQLSTRAAMAIAIMALATFHAACLIEQAGIAVVAYLLCLYTVRHRAFTGHGYDIGPFVASDGFQTARANGLDSCGLRPSSPVGLDHPTRFVSNMEVEDWCYDAQL